MPRNDSMGNIMIVIDDEVKFAQELAEQYSNEGFDYECEDFWESEFNRIFVTYTYPDVTYAN